MADGGYEFGYKDPDLDNLLDNDDSDYQFTKEDIDAAAIMIPKIEERLSVTAPFVPSGSSTPYHGGESYEMPSYYERTPLKITDEYLQRRLDNLRNGDTGMLRTDVPIPPNPRDLIDEGAEIKKVRNFIKARFPNAKVNDMVMRFSKDPKTPLDIICCFRAKRWRDKGPS